MALANGKRVNKVVVADANVLFRRGLRALLSAESDLEAAGEAGSLVEALTNADTCSAHVLIIDLDLVRAGDQESISAVRQVASHIAVLFLTQEDTPERLQTAIAAGARGYMLKNSSPTQLLAGVRRVALGEDLSQGISASVPDLQALAASNPPNTRIAPLTSREEEVMRLLAEGRTVREVAAELSLSTKTIEAHKLNLMRKLDIHNRASLVEHAIRRGLVPAAVIS